MNKCCLCEGSNNDGNGNIWMQIVRQFIYGIELRWQTSNNIISPGIISAIFDMNIKLNYEEKGIYSPIPKKNAINA